MLSRIRAAKAAGVFQFLGIPPKGEHDYVHGQSLAQYGASFPISRDPPEGGTEISQHYCLAGERSFPISRDPPEGGTSCKLLRGCSRTAVFQFLGIPPKGERRRR